MDWVYYKAEHLEDNEPIQQQLEENGFQPMSGKGFEWMAVEAQFVVSIDVNVAAIIAAITGFVAVVQGSRTVGLIIRGHQDRIGRYELPSPEEPAQLPEAIETAFKDIEAGAEGDRTWTGDGWD